MYFGVGAGVGLGVGFGVIFGAGVILGFSSTGGKYSGAFVGG